MRNRNMEEDIASSMGLLVHYYTGFSMDRSHLKVWLPNFEKFKSDTGSPSLQNERLY